MAGPFHPQRVNGIGRSLVNGQSMGKINHFILRSMNNKDLGSHLLHLFNAEGKRNYAWDTI